MLLTSVPNTDARICQMQQLLGFPFTESKTKSHGFSNSLHLCFVYVDSGNKQTNKNLIRRN